MTAHELATVLLAGPDLPVLINGWGSNEGQAYEVYDVEGAMKWHFIQDAETEEKAIRLLEIDNG